MADPVIKNKYRVLRRIGRGGMGSVYEVQHELLGVRRALKQLSVDLQNHPDLQRRFLIEAQTMARLDHPNIVRIYDVDFDDDFGAYILMEYVRGEDLGSLVRNRGALSYFETLDVGISVASALACAHRNNVVHRDVKPANILIEEGSQRPVVTDFGIAKRLELVEDSTMTGGFLGTVRYSSREQICNNRATPIDARADVYSLGVVLYEVFSGKKFLADRSEGEIIALVGFKEGWRPELALPDHTPESFGSLLYACLAPDRDERVSSADEVLACLSACRAELLDTEVARDVVGMDVPSFAVNADAATALPLAAAIDASASTLPTVGAGHDEADQSQVRWRDLLHALRSTVDQRASEFEALLKELIGLEIPRDEFLQLDDISLVLHGVELAERSGQYEKAASGLSDLSARLDQLNHEMERTLADAFVGAATALRAEWSLLEGEAGDLLPAAETASFDEQLAQIDAWLARRDWQVCRAALLTARGCLEIAHRKLRSTVGDRTAAALAEVRNELADLQQRSPERAAELAATIRELEPVMEAELAGGAFARALERGEEGARLVREAIVRANRTETARMRAEQARVTLQRDEASEVAGKALATADAVHALGREALARRDEAAAEQAFERAAEIYGRMAASVDEIMRERLASAESTLRAALDRTTQDNDGEVQDARRAGLRVLSAERPRQRLVAIEKMRVAAAQIDRAVASSAARAAGECEELARLASARAAEVGLAGADLASGERLLDRARQAMEAGRFTDARAEFPRAAHAFEQARALALARADASRLATARAELDAAFVVLDCPIAVQLCGGELARARAHRDASLAAELAGEITVALEETANAIDVLNGAIATIIATLGGRADALSARISQLVEQSGALALGELTGELAAALSNIERSREGRDMPRMLRALDAADLALERCRRAVRERVGEIASQRIAVLRSTVAEIQTFAGATAAEVEPIERGVERLLDSPSPAEALAVVEDALAGATRALEGARAHERERCHAASEAARAALGLVDEEAARAVAAGDLADLESLLAAADLAASAEPGTAIALYDRAVAGAESLCGVVRRWQRDQALAERELLARALADSASLPEEVAGVARAGGRALLEGPLPEDPRSALVELRRARGLLDDARSESLEFEAARGCQSAAYAALQQATTLPVRRRWLKEGIARLRMADERNAERSWLAAARSYEASSRALEVAIEREQALRRSRPAVAPLARLRWALTGLTATIVVLALWLGWRRLTEEPATDLATIERLAPDTRTGREPTIATPAEGTRPDRDDAAGRTDVAKREVPVQAPALAPGFLPDTSLVTVQEGSHQDFGIRIDPARAKEPRRVVWRLDGLVVGRDVEHFDYAPDYQAARAEPRTLEVVVEQDARTVAHSWQIDVQDVNRKPVLTTSPRAGDTVIARPGASVELRADARDDDGDPLTFTWEVNGKRTAATGPTISLPAANADRSVTVSVGDGHDTVRVAWQIAAIPPLRLQVTPGRLERLRFAQPQEFAVLTPDATTELSIEWSIDGKKVATGPRFAFANDDPTQIRSTPIRIQVSALGADGRSFQRDWAVRIEPPPLEVAATIPPPGAVEVDPERPQTFALEARSPIASQELAYVFEIDGRSISDGGKARFEYRSTDDQSHRIVAYLKDNFGQRSARTEWTVRPAIGIDRRAREWLQLLEDAYNAKDASEIGRLRSLGSDAVARIRDALGEQEGLQVRFGQPQLETIDARTVRVTYTRSDRFVDSTTGRPVDKSGPIEVVLTLSGGRIQEIRTR